MVGEECRRFWWGKNFLKVPLNWGTRVCCAEKYNLKSAEPWQFIRYSAAAEDILWVDSKNKLFYGVDHHQLNIPADNFFQNRRLNIFKSGNSIYFLSSQNGLPSWLQYDLRTQKTIPLFKDDYTSGVSLSSTGIFYAPLINEYSNIFSAAKVP